MELLLSILNFLNPFFWINKVIKYYKRPKLVVYYDANETYHLRGIAELNNVQGFFCHLMVKNDGKEIAKNCRARLIDVQIEGKNGNFTKHKMFSAPMILKWAHEKDFNPKNIENDIPRRLDICYGIQTQNNSLFIFTEHNSDGNLKIYPPGKYKFKVRIDSENAKTVDGCFAVEFQGVWNQIRVYEL